MITAEAPWNFKSSWRSTLKAMRFSIAKPACCIARNELVRQDAICSSRRPGSRLFGVRNHRLALAFALPSPVECGHAADHAERNHRPEHGTVVVMEEAKDLFAVHRSQPRQQRCNGWRAPVPRPPGSIVWDISARRPPAGTASMAPEAAAAPAQTGSRSHIF